MVLLNYFKKSLPSLTYLLKSTKQDVNRLIKIIQLKSSWVLNNNLLQLKRCYKVIEGKRKINKNTIIIYFINRIMEWIKVCNKDSLGNGDLIGFDYNNKELLIAKVQDVIYATDRIWYSSIC